MNLSLKLIMVWTLFFLLSFPFSSAVETVRQPKIPWAVINSVSKGTTMPQTTLSQPLSMDLSGSKITVPAGETVAVKKGTASFSYIDSAITKTGGAIESGTSVATAKNV